MHDITVGLTVLRLAVAIASSHFKAHVAVTTRSRARAELLREAGVAEVIIDSGFIAEQVQVCRPAAPGPVLPLSSAADLFCLHGVQRGVCSHSSSGRDSSCLEHCASGSWAVCVHCLSAGLLRCHAK